jgi:hypothetical protein
MLLVMRVLFCELDAMGQQANNHGVQDKNEMRTVDVTKIRVKSHDDS